MARIREALDRAAHALGLNKPLLPRAQRRYKANRKRAFKFHAKALKAQELADRNRAEGGYNATQAAFIDRKAARLHHKASANHDRAQFWLGRVKVLTQRIEGLETTRAELEGERKKLGKVTIKGDRATGGSVRGRLKAVALASAANCASGKRPNFYSQAGAFDADHCITGPAYGHRDDCSSWFASVYKSAGLPDPNGQRYTAGYTGTLGANGRQVSLSQIKPGDAVLYGAFPHHHVEMFVGPGSKTIGHGSAPVDAGVIDLFGDGDYTVRSYR
jgi:cell wall-associated NlpC family hydrolase